MNKLAHAKPDGYTIALTTVGPSTLVPNKTDVGYTTKEFSPIAQVADVPNVISVRKDSGVKTLKELFTRGEKETLTYGTSGAGHTQNIQMETLLMLINKPELLTHVPFDGGSQAIAALLGGQISASMNIVPEPLPHIQNGAFIGLCITSSERDPALPDVPTLKELGYALEGGVWYGYAAPAKTPPSIVAKLDEALAQATGLPNIQEIFKKLGSPVQYLNSEAFTEKWLKTYETNKGVMEKMKK
jgi:tripartite-type tricarboxylate transporter receptor subunit TctC